MQTTKRKKTAAKSKKPSQRELVARRNEYAAKFFPYIEKVARRLARRLPAHVEIDDLISSGVIGLMEAAERFDPKRVDRFEAFAEFRIRGAMLDDLRSRDTLSRDMRRLSNELRDATRRLESQLGRTPDQEEIARRLGVGVDELYARQQKLSGSSVVGIDDAGPDLLERTGDDTAADPFEIASRREMLARLVVGHRRAAREDAAGALALLLRELEPEGDRRGPGRHGVARLSNPRRSHQAPARVAGRARRRSRRLGSESPVARQGGAGGDCAAAIIASRKARLISVG